MVMRGNVQAPTPRAPQYGLIAAAPAVDSNAPDFRLVNGWAFLPEGCGSSGKLSVECEGNTAEMSSGLASPDAVEGEPVFIFAEDRCSTIGFQSRDWLGRARRQLAAILSYELADELWNGTVSLADGLVNRTLAGVAAESDTLTAGGVTPLAALGCITEGLAVTLKGQQGMVHVTPQMLQHLAADSIVTRQGNLWVTAMGHIVVADAGYSGDGPGGVAAGATQWIYGTPMLRVRLGTVETIPGSLDDARSLAQALDYPVNTMAVFAGQLAGVQWDNVCSHLAAEVTLPICALGGGA